MKNQQSNTSLSPEKEHKIPQNVMLAPHQILKREEREYLYFEHQDFGDGVFFRPVFVFVHKS